MHISSVICLLCLIHPWALMDGRVKGLVMVGAVAQKRDRRNSLLSSLHGFPADFLVGAVVLVWKLAGFETGFLKEWNKCQTG